MISKQIELLSDAEWPADAFAVHLPIRPEMTALGVIDMQHYAISPDRHLAQTVRSHCEETYRSYAGRMNQAIVNVQRLLACFRELERRVFYTRHGMLLADGADLIVRRRGREHIALDSTRSDSGHLPVAGTPGHQISPEVAPRSGDLVLDKNTSSAFNSTSIDLFLRNMGIETIVLTGIASDQCVFATALDAADRGFHVILANDACAGFDQGSAVAVQILFGRVWGYVMETVHIVDWMRTGRLPVCTRVPVMQHGQ